MIVMFEAPCSYIDLLEMFLLQLTSGWCRRNCHFSFMETGVTLVPITRFLLEESKTSIKVFEVSVFSLIALPAGTS